jgi:2-aminomuconate deaminase
MTAKTLTKPMATYVHARRVGDLLFVAGQGSRDPVTDAYAGVTRDSSGRVIAHDIAAQTAAVLANVERALRAEGLSRADLVDVTVFLTDMDEFQAMNDVWNQFFAETPAPTRTTVAVVRLPGDNFVEMKAIAAFSV